MNLPSDFLIGAATAAHQVEGNNIYSDYWVMEHVKHSDFVEPSGDAWIVSKLSDEQLTYLCVGNFKDGMGVASIIGEASQKVAGAAGETTARIAGVPVTVMADGPAGLRFSMQYTRDETGVHPVGSTRPAGLDEFFLETLVRGEWGYDGLIMTDWVVTAMGCKGEYRAAKAVPTIKAGNNLFMPGGPADYKSLVKALQGKDKNFSLTRTEIVCCAEWVVDTASRLVQA